MLPSKIGQECIFMIPETEQVNELMENSLPSFVEPIAVVVEQGKNYWWCACGLSAKQPFCDGSHKGTSITPVQYQATESGKKWFCVCKKTQNRPFCDGSHQQVTETVAAAP
jgi:CDGSH iron-sulfur domain-containing protein 3